MENSTYTKQPLNSWISRFESLAHENGDAELRRGLETTYGRAGSQLRGICGKYRQLLQSAAELWGGDTRVGILRSPGRVNLMGRHVDHQGGHCNLMAIDREIRMAFRSRSDGEFHLWNVDASVFPLQSFPLGDLIGHADRIQAAAGFGEKAVHWGVYFQASALRLQERYPERPLCGFDAVVSGDIPMGAGLSSSSALVVACMEALVRINDLPLSGKEFVDECGEGEKYVGTRGGSADHAAIRLSQRGRILHVTFFPFRIERTVPFPENLCAVVCHSGEEAHKATGARNIFNSRVTAYAMARELVRNSFPHVADRVEHLRDINQENLGVPLEEIYRMLASLPQAMDRKPFLERVPEDVGDTINRELFAAHDEPVESYPVRGVALYGLAECARSARTADLLERGDAESIGEQMLVSHDSERFLRHDSDLKPEPVQHDSGDQLFQDLVAKAESGDPTAALWRQPGYYRCSTPGIDLIVDAAMTVPGVYGAQLAGAGLGGCAMVLAETSAVHQLVERLEQVYYRPRGIEPLIIPCRPVGGCECL